jgi:hypothetical protein
MVEKPWSAVTNTSVFPSWPASVSGGAGRRAVDAGNETALAVDRAVLRRVGIARPVEQDERLAVVFQVGDQRLGRDRDEPGLLCDVRGTGEGRVVVAGDGESLGAERAVQLGAPGRGAVGVERTVGGVVDEDAQRIVDARILGIERADVLDRGRTFLAQDRGVEAGGTRRADQRGLAHIAIVEMVLHVFQDAIVFEERHRRALAAGHREIDEQRVAIIAGVAEVMAGRNGRGVGGRHGRIDRMAVDEVDALTPDAPEGRRGLRRDAVVPQPVGHEDDDVAVDRRGMGGGRQGKRGGEGGGGETCGQHRWNPWSGSRLDLAFATVSLCRYKP